MCKQHVLSFLCLLLAQNDRIIRMLTERRTTAMSTNNSSHDRKRSATEADFKANGLQQCKVHLARKGVSQLEIGMAGNTIPDISDVIRNARWLTETHETKLGACLFQISFLVTIGSKLLVVDRSDRNEGRNLSGSSVLLSSSPYEVVTPTNLKHLDDILRRKFRYKKGTPEICFLGLVKNRVFKKKEQSYADYYFYVFLAHFDEQEFTFADAKAAIKSASIDQNDCAVGIFDVDENLINKRINSKFNADRAALKLYLQYETERKINMLEVKGVGRSISSHGVMPVHHLSGRYFVSHATADYKTIVRPLCVAVDEKYRQSLHPLDRATSAAKLTWTHECDASLDCEWATKNLPCVYQCAGFISIESKAFEKRDDVIEEIVGAIKGNLQNNNYRIIRVCYERMDDFEVFAKKLRKRTADVLGDEKYAEIYLNKTFFPLYAYPEKLLSEFVDNLYSSLL